ncbi:MAG TPA: hypothetical protein VGG29_03835, partial [Caulobacteraceae bacterium]
AMLAPLWANYSSIRDHYAGFNDSLFPGAVELAGDIVDYGRDQAPTYFGALKDIATKLHAGDMTAEDARASVHDIVAALQSDAQDRAQRAVAAQTDLKAFADNLPNFLGALTAQSSALAAAFGDLADEIETLTARIAKDAQELADATKEMENDLVIAETSAFYVWMVPVGTIAACIVAGIYFERASKAAGRISDAMDDAEKAGAELISATLSKSSYVQTTLEGQQLGSAINDALPTIASLQSVWDTAAGAYGALLGKLGDASKVGALLDSLKIDQALADWKSAADAADRYRVSAFIAVLSEDEAKAKAAEDPKTLAPKATS